MVEIDSEGVAWKKGVWSVVTVVALLSSLLFNIVALLLFSRSRKLRRPANMLLASLALADGLAALLWLLPALVVASSWRWPLGSGLCKAHGFFGLLFFILNTFTLTVVAVEKFFKAFFPRQHSDAFSKYTIVTVVVATLWLSAPVLAMLPLVGWGEVVFFNYQLQCVSDWVESESHLHFHFTVSLFLPTVAMLALYVVTLTKMRRTNNAQLLLPSSTAYADTLHRQQEKFKASHTDSDSSDADFTDEDETFPDYEDYRATKMSREADRQRRRAFALRKEHLRAAVAMAAVSLIFVCLWLPFVVVTFLWVHDPSAVSESVYSVTSVITFFGVSFKPLIYISLPRFRLALRKIFSRSKK